jgi:RNase P subunit RPR2
MSDRTCVACDSPLDGEAIQVRIGGRTVEVCCEDCAWRLNEAAAVAAEGA